MSENMRCVACDSVVWSCEQPAGGVAIERRFNLARVGIDALQIQNIIAYILLECVCRLWSVLPVLCFCVSCYDCCSCNVFNLRNCRIYSIELGYGSHCC
jgi:hypothetical protein